MGRRFSGRREKSTTERLPKAERRESGPKLTVRRAFALSPSSSTASLTSALSSVSLVAAAAPPRPPAGAGADAPPALLLPEEVLRRILRAAGLLAVVNATRVARQWRTVALQLLAHTRRVDAATLFRPLPPSELSYAVVLRALSTFPCLTRMSLRGWPAAVALQDIAASVMQHYASPILADIDLSGLAFQASDLHALASHCPALDVVRLVGCDCVDDGVVARLVHSRRDAMRDRRAARFQLLDISHCRAVSKQTILLLLQSNVVGTLNAANCEGFGVLNVRNVRARELNLSASRGLYAAFFDVRPSSLLALNLSRCQSLTRVTVTRAVADGVPDAAPLALQSLNLAGCGQLHDIDWGPPPSVAAAGAARRVLPGISSISLFGARALGPEFFRSRLALSGPECTMPKLRHLDLNGCLGLDRLVLVDYPVLATVDCSGCLILDHLRVGGVPSLERLVVKGRRAPLRHVDLSVPASAKVQGVRASWITVHHAALTLISYEWAPGV